MLNLTEVDANPFTKYGHNWMSRKEEVVASDLLQSAKVGITSYAKAIAEAATDDVRTVLQNHLQDAKNEIHSNAAIFVHGHFP